jgi:hypothetical protein
MTQLNNRIFTVANRTANTFQLQGVNGSGYNSYSSGGTATRCQTTNCEVVVTSASHGLADGAYAYVTGVGGITQINNGANSAWLISGATANTFVLSGSSVTLPGPSGTTYGTYTSGGAAACTAAGCQYYRYQNPAGNWRVNQISTCVTERAINPFTDDAPSTTWLGRNYRTSSAPCTASIIVPLSTDKPMLQNVAANLIASGSTAGHVGLAWSWYMVSPNFASLWPSASQPADYGEPNLLKVVILMTDGAFNTTYCNGVISADTLNGAAAERINCNAPNGTSLNQGGELCDSMKAVGVIVYTVGFDLGGDPGAQALMAGCATDAAHAYIAETGADLTAAFQEIGQTIASLRVSR